MCLRSDLQTRHDFPIRSTRLVPAQDCHESIVPLRPFPGPLAFLFVNWKVQRTMTDDEAIGAYLILQRRHTLDVR